MVLASMKILASLPSAPEIPIRLASHQSSTPYLQLDASHTHVIALYRAAIFPGRVAQPATLAYMGTDPICTPNSADGKATAWL